MNGHKAFAWPAGICDHSPPPLASEGSESPSVVRGAGFSAFGLLPAPQPRSVWVTSGASRGRVLASGCGPHLPLDTPSVPALLNTLGSSGTAFIHWAHLVNIEDADLSPT